MLKKCFKQFLLTSTCLFLCFKIFAQESVTFVYTGFPQQWVVPSCVTDLTVTCVGASGGGNNGGAGATVYGSLTETSDIALKTDIQPLTNVLDKIKQISGYKYQFKETGHDSMGVTAQDVEKVFPEIVKGSEGEKTLAYSGLVGALVEAVKELSTKNDALETRIKTLEG